MILGMIHVLRSSYRLGTQHDSEGHIYFEIPFTLLFMPDWILEIGDLAQFGGELGFGGKVLHLGCIPLLPTNTHELHNE